MRIAPPARAATSSPGQPGRSTPPRLLVLTDRSQLRLGRGLVPTLGECAAAGLTHVLLRELDLTLAQRVALCEQLTALGLHVVAAHAWLPGCVGLHLPAGTFADAKLFGRSCHTTDEVRRAATQGAAWATLGPLAESASKPGRAPIDPDSYAGLPIPTLALGGITPRNAGAALRAGAHGVAVMGEVMRAADPAAVVGDLLDRLTEVLA